MPHSPCIDLDEAARQKLLDIARYSIESGAIPGEAPRVDFDSLEQTLHARFAVFVTLTRLGALRGCVGSLQALDRVAQAVANAAFNAAFRDRRFTPLETVEFASTRIEVSVLSPLEPLVAESRQVLLEQLRPGIDGLVVEDRGHRATFLPKVWEQLDSPDQFLRQLFQKAGLAGEHWSRNLKLQRYTTLTFAEPGS